MGYLILAAQIISGIATIILVLLHTAKGEGLGGIGGSASLFTGPSQAEAGLDKMTWIVVSVFIFCSAMIGWGIIKF